MQQDILLPSLTVRETLQYSARLRLPYNTATVDRFRIVEEVILELGLKECANTRVGHISGGEKRRTSIGVQMLANPSVLFLDEPTTGLDTTSAFQLVRTLKALALKGRTVVTTIHQPRGEIWDLFDSVIILSRGEAIYSGSATDCIPWFRDLGYPLPSFVNPAEFLSNLAAVDLRSPELELQSAARVDALAAAWHAEESGRFPPLLPLSPAPNAQQHIRRQQQNGFTAFWTVLRCLTSRTLKVTYRDPLGMAAAISEAIIMGTVTGYIFFHLARDESGIRSRQGGCKSPLALTYFRPTLFFYILTNTCF